MEPGQSGERGCVPVGDGAAVRDVRYWCLRKEEKNQERAHPAAKEEDHAIGAGMGAGEFGAQRGAVRGHRYTAHNHARL